MAFKAQQRKISDLFTGSILEIPRNQRRYVWKEDNWKDLLYDLKFVIETKEDNKKHFLGSIVLKEESSINGVNHFTIIDGQQRTFTLILFLSAIMQLFKERNMEDDFKGTSKLLIVTDLKNNSSCILNSDFYLSLSKIVLQICNWDNRSILTDIFQTEIHNKRLEKSIIDCTSYYYDNLKVYSDEELLAIRDSLLETNFIEITATTDEDSYTIFEILNARGQDLEDHELLKNYIMRYIRPKEQIKIDEVKIKWTDDIDNGLGRSINKFFRHYATHRFSAAKKDNIYRTIQRAVAKREINTLFEDILHKVKYYKAILKPEIEGETYECSQEEFQIFTFFGEKKVEQFRPTLLSLMHQRELNYINQIDYNKTLRYLYLFFVCYNIIGEEKSNRLEDPIYKYSSLLENSFSMDILYEFIESLNSRLPNKETFINTFKSVGWSNHTPFYSGSKNKDRVKIILEILEKNKSKRNLTDYTLEHIYPDSGGEENALVGNILPLESELNRRCENKPVQKKIPIYKESNFAITRGFAIWYENNPGKYNPKQRTDFLAGFIYDLIVNKN